MGRRLVSELLRENFDLVALARPGSEHKLPAGSQIAFGSALDANTYANRVGGSDTFIHLIGASHPSPAKAREFREVDLKSVAEALKAAKAAGSIQHFVYVSVAQPAPVMKAYTKARFEAESLIRASGIPATILRPWYVLGPGHRWPMVLIPFYWVLERLPGTRESAQRLGLVTIDQMTAALVGAVKHPCSGECRIAGVPEIRAAIFA